MASTIGSWRQEVTETKGVCGLSEEKAARKESISNPGDINWAVGTTAACLGPCWGKKEGVLCLGSVSP